WCRQGGFGRVERHGLPAVPPLSHEDDALALAGPVQRMRQRRAGQHAQLHLALDDQRKRDGVLIAAQETARAVEWVERPEPLARPPAAPIDPLADLTSPRRSIRGEQLDQSCE